MPAIPVTSSWIASVEYDEDKKTLDVNLDSGESYTYQGVPAKVAQAFVDAPSKGAFFVKNIKFVYAEKRD